MTFRFIHTADIHLDSPLKSLGMRNQELADVIANGTRQVLVRIVDLCLSEQVDALLIAGDLYDGDQTSMKTARFLASQLRRLDEAHIRVFIIRGNHDAESKITKELTLPDCVHVFGGKAESVAITSNDADASPLERPVVIHGTSFRKPHAPESLLPQYKSPDPGALNIGMMHTSLDGAAGHDPYAPCSLADLQNHGFDYWALGHIHKHAIYKGSSCTVVMPGIPQGRDIGESGEKTVTLVTTADDGSVETEEHALAVAQFEEIEVSLDELGQWPKAINRVMEHVDRVAEACAADHLVARIVLTGSTPLSWKLRRDEDLFQQDITSRLEDDGHRWLDKLIIRCESPVEVSDTLSAGPNPHEELYKLMIEEIRHSTTFHSHAKQAMEDLLGVLPGELRAKFGEDETQLAQNMQELALQGSILITANLQSESSADGPTVKLRDET